MKTKEKKQPQPLTLEDALREKAGHYLVCFIDQCPLHDQCLRWLAGQYVDTMPLAHNAINPHNPKIGGEQCIMFRKSERVLMKRGLTNLYYDMPGHMEKSIRAHLISLWGRNQYFEMRRGKRLITPSRQQDIADVCRQHGWTGPIVYDGEQEDWLW